MFRLNLSFFIIKRKIFNEKKLVVEKKRQRFVVVKIFRDMQHQLTVDNARVDFSDIEIENKKHRRF